MRVFLCGPMSGLREWNYPAFLRKAAELRALGYEVLSPAENFPDPVKAPDWADCLRASIGQLIQADAVYLLGGWRESRGARIERHLAYDLELPLYGWGCKELDNALAEAAKYQGLNARRTQRRRRGPSHNGQEL